MDRVKVRITDCLLALLLGAFVGVPLVVAVWADRQGAESTVEKRELASLPPVPGTFDGWIRFPHAFDAWATDRFGFRDDLLSGYKWLMASVFGQSASAGAYVGKDGWLYVTKDDALKDALGQDPYSQREIDNIVQQILARGDLLTARHVRFVFLAAPDKHTVYPQYLPGGVYGGFDRRRLSALDAAMRASGHDYYVDISDDLIKAAPQSPFQLYYMADTHWNPWGAYLGYRAFLHDWKDSPIEHPTTYRFAQFRIPGRIAHGDLGVMSGYWSHDRDIWPPASVICYKLEPWSVPAGLARRINRASSYFGQIDCPAGHGVALVVHDSFMDGMLFYLPRNFQRSYYVWKYVDDRAFASLVNLTRPSTVIVERVERMMRTFPQTDIPALLAGLGLVGQPVRQDADRLLIGSGDAAVTRQPEAVVATVDKVIRHDDTIELQGWARNAAGRPPAVVIAVSGGKVVAEAPLAVKRQDVAHGTADSNLTWSGFQLEVPAAAARRAHADLQVYFVDFDDYGKWRMPDAVMQKMQTLAAQGR